jgi:hypothetical protein
VARLRLKFGVPSFCGDCESFDGMSVGMVNVKSTPGSSSVSEEAEKCAAKTAGQIK